MSVRKNLFIVPSMKKMLPLVLSVFGVGALTFGTFGFAYASGATSQSSQNASQANNDSGYPNLRDIPVSPDSVVSSQEWASELTDLNAKNSILSSQAYAQYPSAAELDFSWAEQTRAGLLSNPNSAPAPSIEDSAAWAARMRALLDSELKTTPH